MAYATHISLKVKLDEDIRRFSVQKDISFADLHSLISKHFVLAPESVQIKYIDDEEELITLGSDLELQEAKRLQPTVLRLNVYDVKPRRCASSDQPLPQLMAVFVRDVTVPDGTSVTANVKFQKVWRVKNTGTATWPKGGVVLKMVDPNDGQLRVLAVGTITRAVGPDEETDIGVELQAPSRPGRCVQYWRLFAEDGSAFGSRLWVDITVVQDNAAAEKELAEQAEAMRLAEEEEQQLRLQREEEERRRLEEEAMLRKLQEEEKARYEEELARQMEELKRQLEEDERRKQEEEKAAAAAAAEAEAAALQKKREEEEEARRQAEEEARRQAEEEARRQAEAALKKKQEEEARRQAEEEARRQAAAALKKKQEEEEAKKRQLYSKYPGQLTALAEMGFTNVEHNVKLLDKHKGSLDLALEALLSGQ